jgi:hypothetical protein
VFAASDDGERVGETAALLRVSVAYVSKALTRRRMTGETTAQHGHKLPKLAPFYAAIRAYIHTLPNEAIPRSRNCGHGCWRHTRSQRASR